MTLVLGVLALLYALVGWLVWLAARVSGARATPSAASAARRFTRRHAWAALLAALPCILLVLLFTGRPLIALGTLLGPMAGPAARNWPPIGDDCCMDNGLHVLPWGLASLVLAFATQWLLPAAWHGRLRLAGWMLGLGGWCFCGLVTYAHALE